MARRGENIYKRKDGRWEGRYKSGYREDGQAVMKNNGEKRRFDLRAYQQAKHQQQYHSSS